MCIYVYILNYIIPYMFLCHLLNEYIFHAYIHTSILVHVCITWLMICHAFVAKTLAKDTSQNWGFPGGMAGRDPHGAPMEPRCRSPICEALKGSWWASWSQARTWRRDFMRESSVNDYQWLWLWMIMVNHVLWFWRIINGYDIMEVNDYHDYQWLLSLNG